MTTGINAGRNSTMIGNSNLCVAQFLRSIHLTALGRKGFQSPGGRHPVATDSKRFAGLQPGHRFAAVHLTLVADAIPGCRGSAARAVPLLERPAAIERD